MANFCRYCGKALQDGEICSCPQAQAEAAQQYQSQPPQGYQQPPQGYQQPPQGYQQPPQGYQPPQPPQGYQPPLQGYPPPPQGYQPQPPQQPAAPNPFVIALQKVLPYLKAYLKAPVSTAQSLMAQKDLTFAGVLLCIQAIVSGLFLFGVLQSLCNVINMMSGISFGASFFMSLIFGILAGAGAMLVYVVILFAMAKIVGSGCTFVDAVIASAAHVPFVCVLLLASFLLLLLFMPLGLLLYSASMVAWMVLTIPALQSLVSDPNKGKFWICLIVGLLVIQLVGAWVAFSLGSNAVGHMTISAGGETHSFNELGRGIGDLLDRLF